jgi:hypothetical protein
MTLAAKQIIEFINRKKEKEEIYIIPLSPSSSSSPKLSPLALALFRKSNSSITKLLLVSPFSSSSSGSEKKSQTSDCPPTF